MKKTRYIPKEQKLIINLGPLAPLPQMVAPLRSRNIVSWVQMNTHRGNSVLSFRLVPRDQLGPIELLARLADDIASIFPEHRGVRSPWEVGDHAGHVNLDRAVDMIGDVFRHVARQPARTRTHALAG